MKLIKSIIDNYLSISEQLFFYVSKHDASQVLKYSTDQYAEALKLVTALCTYHGITAEEVTGALAAEGRDG